MALKLEEIFKSNPSLKKEWEALSQSTKDALEALFTESAKAGVDPNKRVQDQIKSLLNDQAGLDFYDRFIKTEEGQKFQQRAARK